jgi:hypothetical protein
LFQKVLQKLNGLYYHQEYLCLAKESFPEPLYAYLTDGRQIIKNITDEHVFAGYNPLIITLYTLTGQPELPVGIEIILSRQPLRQNELYRKKDAIALLSLQLIKKQSAGDLIIYYYEGIKGEHHFLSSFHQYIIGLSNRLYNKKAGNVFLHDNLYKQVQIAYSLPRTISLVTVGENESYNLFPTDLHGTIGQQYYVDSLRHQGKACEQVERLGKMVISEVHADAYKTVYSLGKNHMQDLKPFNNFPFGGAVSQVFQLPLPEPVLYYRELELLGSFKHGIHKLLLFKTISSNSTGKAPDTLAHIHDVYATWRHNKGLAGNYLLR